MTIPDKRLIELLGLKLAGFDLHFETGGSEIVEMVEDILALRQQVKDKDLQIKEWREDACGLAEYSGHLHFCQINPDFGDKCNCGGSIAIDQHNALLEKYPEEK